jgi:hypothetical protein
MILTVWPPVKHQGQKFFVGSTPKTFYFMKIHEKGRSEKIFE